MTPLELLPALNVSSGAVFCHAFQMGLTGGSKRHELMHGMLIAVIDKEQAACNTHTARRTRQKSKKLAAEGMG